MTTLAQIKDQLCDRLGIDSIDASYIKENYGDLVSELGITNFSKKSSWEAIATAINTRLDSEQLQAEVKAADDWVDAGTTNQPKEVKQPVQAVNLNAPLLLIGLGVLASKGVSPWVLWSVVCEHMKAKTTHQVDTIAGYGIDSISLGYQNMVQLTDKASDSWQETTDNVKQSWDNGVNSFMGKLGWVKA